eukprot:CAMPEP_0196143438 /NCGR_PEP_ID=MMETSP0910-20130528/13357_1 /TAXON_ID=49265 /ORGANISM="Thalassiosira rotula, Strain GSO102" /LENGTH=130 /DNA_ID=CAMNT_0041404895 /DNA_START=69 /DNA_END=460 /DNA_ORIENTATION=-
MPLLKIFSQQPLRVSAKDVLHPALMTIWNVPEDALKVLVLPTHEMSGNEDLYIDVRAMVKLARTKEVVDKAMSDMRDLFKSHGYTTNIRVELYDSEFAVEFTEAKVDTDGWMMRVIVMRCDEEMMVSFLL